MIIAEKYLGVEFSITNNGDGTYSWQVNRQTETAWPAHEFGTVAGGQEEAILTARKAIGHHVRKHREPVRPFPGKKAGLPPPARPLSPGRQPPSPQQDRRTIEPKAASAQLETKPAGEKSVLFSGVIASKKHRLTFRCTVLDFTECFARISMISGRPLPSDFYFINLRERTASEAIRVWSNAAEAGISFVNSFPVNDPPDPSLAYLSRIWLDYAR